MRVVLLLLLAGTSGTSWAGEAFGVWKLNPARSTLAGNQKNQKNMTLRIEPHTRGEVFTLETVSGDARASTFSTILYFDGKPRDFQDSTCSGTQLSRRRDTRSIEIVCECASGQVRLVRRAVRPGVLILDITEQQADGRRSEQRLVMEKQ